MAVRSRVNGGRRGALGRTQAALSSPDQLASLLQLLQVLQAQQGAASSPDVGTLPSNFPAGGFATTSGQIPVGRVGHRTLGGLPFQPNPVATGIAGVNAILANARAGQTAARQREAEERRTRQVEKLVEGVLRESGLASGVQGGRSTAAGRVGLGTGKDLPATRGGRRIG